MKRIKKITNCNPLVLSIPVFSLFAIGIIVTILSYRAQNYFPVRFPLDETLGETVGRVVMSSILFAAIPVALSIFAVKKLSTRIINASSIFIYFSSLILALLSLNQDYVFNGEYLKFHIGYLYIPTLLCFGFVFMTAKMLGEYLQRFDTFFLIFPLLIEPALLLIKMLCGSYSFIMISAFIVFIFALFISKSIDKKQVLYLSLSFLLIVSLIILTAVVLDKMDPHIDVCKKLLDLFSQKRRTSNFALEDAEFTRVLHQSIKHIKAFGQADYRIENIPAVFYYSFLGTEVDTVLFGGGWIALVIVLALEVFISVVLLILSLESEKLYSKCFALITAAMFFSRTVFAVVASISPRFASSFCCPAIPFLGGHNSVILDLLLYVFSLMLCDVFPKQKGSRLLNSILKIDSELKNGIRAWIEAGDEDEE